MGLVRVRPVSVVPRAVRWVLAWLGWVLLLLPTPGVEAADRVPVRVGVRSGSFSALPVLQAAQAGYFAAAGLAPEIRVYQDEQALAAMLAAGAIEVAVLPTPLFFAIHLGTGEFAGRGRDLVTYQVALTNGSLLVVAAASEIQYSRQFREQTIGFTHGLGMPRLLADIYLQQSGLAPGQDTGWRALSAAGLGEGLRSGAVGGAALGGPIPYRLVAGGEARVMVPLHKLWMDHPAEVIAVTRSFQEGRSAEFRALARATLRAAADLVGGALPEGYAGWREALEETRAGYDPFPYLSSMRVILEELKKRQLTPLNTDLKAVVAAAVLTETCRDGMREAGFREVPRDDSREERMIGCCYTTY